MKKILSTIWVFILSFSAVVAWNGIIAENGDLLNINKWNEMVNIINQKLSIWDIIAGEWVNFTNSGSQIIVNATAGALVPYVNNQNQIVLSPNTTQDISIAWINITPGSQLEIPGFDGTINSSFWLSPNEIIANISAWNSTNQYDIVINNNGAKSDQWPWNWVNLLRIISPVLWNGPAWTYIEWFEANSLWSWQNVAGLDANLTVQQGWTPSTWTWPNQASNGSYYVFAETSNPNYPTKTFWISTNNFRQAQSISFDYHMFGATIWNLEVQILHNWVWSNVYIIKWQQQAAQTDAWLNTGVIDLSGELVEEIRLLYTSGTNYTGDMAIDNISIISQ